jgi:hypothetical protein
MLPFAPMLPLDCREGNIQSYPGFVVTLLKLPWGRTEMLPLPAMLPLASNVTPTSACPTNVTLLDVTLPAMLPCSMLPLQPRCYPKLAASQGQLMIIIILESLLLPMLPKNWVSIHPFMPIQNLEKLIP